MTRGGLALDAGLGLLLAWVGWAGSHVMFRGDGPGPRGGHPRPGPPINAQDGFPVLTDVSLGIIPFLVALAAGVALRRRWPRAAFGAVVVGLAGYLVLGGSFGPILLAPALAVYAMAQVYPVRRWAPLAALLVPTIWLAFSREPYGGLLDPTLYAALVTGVAITILPALVGLLRRGRREAESRERAQDRRRYLDEERLRIAREVHDVVGHSLSVISLQAGVALHVIDQSPGQAADSLEAIRSTSRRALAELRTTIGVFRESDGSAPRGLVPGLDRLDELVGALVAAGREVEVVGDAGDGASLPTAVDQAAFRIIQEALTNVVRHAGPARAIVRLDRSRVRLMIEVADGGPSTVAPSPGNGITGMQERARAVGGTVSVAAASPHGVVVHAELPLTADVEPPVGRPADARVAS